MLDALWTFHSADVGDEASEAQPRIKVGTTESSPIGDATHNEALSNAMLDSVRLLEKCQQCHPPTEPLSRSSDVVSAQHSSDDQTFLSRS